MSIKQFFRIFLSLIISTSVVTTGVVARPDEHSTVVSTAADAKGEVRKWEVTGPWGGDVRSLVAAPENADVLFLGTSDGHIFKSTDGAANWNRLRPGIGQPGLSVDSIAIDPGNSRTMYAGAWSVANDEASGVYKSEDGGATWKLLEGTKKLSVRSVAIAQSDSKIIMAGSANGDPKLNGIFRSSDGGGHWKRISPEGDHEIKNVESIAIEPSNPDIIYIGTFHLPWKTMDGGATWKLAGFKKTGMIDDSDIFGISISQKNPSLMYMNACSGIYRSNSAGEKWDKLPGIPFSARRTYALLAHPAHPEILFAGTSEGLWRSRDGGQRWMLLTSQNVTVRSIVIHPDRPDRVLIATDGFGVEVSNDMGSAFSASNIGFIHRHILAIMPDSTEHGRVLASVFHDGESGSVYVSGDDGESWKLSSRGLGARDVYSFYQSPDDPQTVYAGTTNGVYRSLDRGASWSYTGLVEFKKEVAPKKPEAVRPTPRQPVHSSRRTGAGSTGETRETGTPKTASAKSNATKSVSGKSAGAKSSGTGSTTGSKTTGGTTTAPKTTSGKTASGRTTTGGKATGNRAAKSSNTRSKSVKARNSNSAKKQAEILVPAPRATAFQAIPAVFQQPRRRTTTSRHTTKRKAPVAKTPTPAVGQLTKQVDEISSFVDAQGNRVLLAAAMDGLYRCSDIAKGWDKVYITDYDPMGRVFSVSSHSGLPGTIFAGTRRGLFISHDGGGTWDHVDRGPSDMSVKSIAQDPRDPNLIIVGTNQFIYRSTNGGRSWVMRGGGLINGDYTSVRFNPTNPNEVMACDYSRGGVFRSFDKGATWDRIDAGLPSSRIWTVIFDPHEPGRIFAGSFSSGVYVLTVQSGNAAAQR